MIDLTPRQRQIADLVAEGLRVSEIADQLGISVHTVKQHKQDIYQRLDVRNAVELSLRIRQ